MILIGCCLTQLKGYPCCLFYVLYLQGLQRIICLRQYNGRILFVPAPGFENSGQPASCSVDKEQSVNDKALGYQGPDTKLEGMEWREIKGPFVSVWLHNVPWGAENTLAAPNAKVSYTFCNIFKPGKKQFLNFVFFCGTRKRSLHRVVYLQKNIVKASYIEYMV